MGDSGAQLGDNRAQLFSPNSVRLFLDIDLNIKDLKRWCQIKTPWSRIWTLILLGGRLHLLRRTESLYLGRWTLWGPVLDGRPDMVRHFDCDAIINVNGYSWLYFRNGTITS